MPKNGAEADMKDDILHETSIFCAAQKLCKRSRESYPCPNNEECKKAFVNLESVMASIKSLRQQLWNVSISK
jgi:hypothetical protein